MLLVLFNVVVAFAHHNTYEAWTDCQGNWGASAFYFGGGEKRLVLISGVEINGVLYDPDDTNWSEAPAGYTGGVVPRSEYGGSTNGLPGATDEDFLWVGVSNGWKIFDRSGSNFVPNPGNWEGTIKMFSWNGSQWVQADNDNVWQPTPPGDCPKPKAKIEYACGWEALKVTFKNEGGGDVDFTWKINGVAQESLSVGPYSEKVLHPPINEDETLLVEINGPNGYTKSQQITRNCAGSDASLTYKCGDEKAKLKLENSSDIEQTFQWTLNGQAQSPVVVAAHSSQTVLIPINEDQTLTVVVSGPNNFSKTMEVTRNCKGSDASVVYECGPENAVLTLSNSSDLEQTFNYTVNGVAQTPVVVAPNSNQIVNVPISEDETLTIVVSGPNDFSKSFELTRNCAGSDASLTYQCGEEKAELKLDNTSDISQTFNYTVNGVSQTPVVVDAHSTQTISIPINEDQTLSVVVSGPNGFSKTMEVTRNCTGSDVTATYVCGEDTVPVTFSNTSSLEQTFKWSVNGVMQTPVAVSAQSQVVVDVPIAEDQVLNIEVTGPNSFNKSLEVSRNCEGSQATLDYQCDDDKAVLTLVNESTLQQTFNWTLNGVAQVPVTVAPLSQAEVDVPVAEDQTVTVVVTGPNSFSKTFEVTRNCDGSDATLTYVCGDETAKLTLNNTSVLEQTFKWSVNGVMQTPVAVSAQSQVVVDVPISEDQTLLVYVEGPGGFSKELEVTRNCEEPPPAEVKVDFDLTYECGQAMATATFTNTGTTQQTFVFSSNTMSETIVVVEAGQTVVNGVPINEDQTVTAVVTVQGSDFTKTVTVERDCSPNPSVQASADCKVNEDSLQLILSNEGGGQVTFTVLYGNGTETYLVTEHSNLFLSLPLPERSDQSLPLKVTAPGMEDFETTVSGCGQPTNLPPGEQPQQFGVTLLIPFAARQ
jgi:membrane-bound inhibitor of C-type lysozyme